MWALRVFMQAIMPNLMTTIVAVHALLGCGWHHLHGCAHCDLPTASAAANFECCHHDHASGQDCDSPVHPCDCQLDCHGVCTFLPSQRVHIADSQLLAEHVVAAVLPTLVAIPSSLEGAQQCAESHRGIQLPLRLHLMYQILLI